MYRKSQSLLKCIENVTVCSDVWFISCNKPNYHLNQLKHKRGMHFNNEVFSENKRTQVTNTQMWKNNQGSHFYQRFLQIRVSQTWSYRHCELDNPLWWEAVLCRQNLQLYLWSLTTRCQQHLHQHDSQMYRGDKIISN